MIQPDVDVAKATDEEIIAAYIAEGVSESTAYAYLGVLRNPDPEFPID